MLLRKSQSLPTGELLGIIEAFCGRAIPHIGVLVSTYPTTYLFFRCSPKIHYELLNGEIDLRTAAFLRCPSAWRYGVLEDSEDAEQWFRCSDENSGPIPVLDVLAEGIFITLSEKQKRMKFIADSDDRVKHWGQAKREAFRKAVSRAHSQPLSKSNPFLASPDARQRIIEYLDRNERSIDSRGEPDVTGKISGGFMSTSLITAIRASEYAIMRASARLSTVRLQLKQRPHDSRLQGLADKYATEISDAQERLETLKSRQKREVEDDLFRLMENSPSGGLSANDVRSWPDEMRIPRIMALLDGLLYGTVQVESGLFVSKRVVV